MKKTVRMILFFIAVLSFLTNNANTEELIARVNEWPPFYYTENGEWVGISVDTYDALCREAGVAINYTVLPWSRAMREMKTKSIMVANLTPTDERKKIMHFIGPHRTETLVLAIAREYQYARIENLDDLAVLAKKTGKRISYQQDVFYSKEFNNKIENDIEFSRHFRKMVTTDPLVKLICAGRLLGGFEDVATASYMINKLKMKDKVSIHSFVVNKTDNYVGVSKTVSKMTIKKLQDANQKLLNNGTYKKIEKKWTSMDLAL